MPSGSDIVQNITALLPSLLALINAFAALTGLLFIGYAIILAIRLPKRDPYTKPVMPVMFALSGIMLWNLGTSASTFLETMFGSGVSTESLIGYTPGGGIPEQTGKFLQMLIMCISVYGYFAYVKGLIKAVKIGSGQQSGESVFGSAFWHVVGGAALINIVGTVNLFSSVLGFGDVL